MRRHVMPAGRKKIASGNALSATGAGQSSTVWQQLRMPAGQRGAVCQHVRHERPAMARGHRHREWEFNLVTHGRATCVIDGRRQDLGLDSLLWLLPTQGHLLMDRSDDFSMWVAVFDPDLLRPLCDGPSFRAWGAWLEGQAPGGPVHRNVGEDVGRSLQQLCERLAQRRWGDPAPVAADPPAHSAGLTWLAAEAWLAYDAAPDLPRGSHLHPGVQRALTWIAEHAHLPAADDLDDLARRCHLSRPHLSRLFKEQTGSTLTEFRCRQRLDRFTALLGRGKRHTMTQAAYAAGFGSYAQAFRTCKRLTGRGPRGYLGARFI